jgi:uncharacterized OB-fold protein
MTASGFLHATLDDPLTRPFWDGCARGELLVQQFPASRQLVWPPRPMDPVSRTLEHEWVPVSGAGTIWSFVVAHPPLLPAYEVLAPYNVIVVALAEDPALRMVGNLVESVAGPLDGIDPSTITIGEPVRVVFAEQDGIAVPRWVRA